jgi:hypothetical protein
MEYELSDDEAIKEYINYLVEEGGLVLNGITDDGEPIYTHNMEVLEVIAPEYAAMHLREIEDTLIGLYEKGLVDIEITDTNEVVYKINPSVDLGQE